MKLKIFGNECWIKDGVELSSNFNQMNDDEKMNYIRENQLFHREDGPAFIGSDGSEWWFLNGKKHREDGPAYISSNGYQEWCLNGLLYRLDGPAVIRSNGTVFWYLNDALVDGETYKKIQDSSKEELLVYMIDSEYKDYLPLIEYRLSL